MLRGALKSHL
uniref:Uncharacterized protein n=1 Tax=Anguilla anguilla TaxID=7936 RepID=A0A0E9XSL0_ANGAN